MGRSAMSTMRVLAAFWLVVGCHEFFCTGNSDSSLDELVAVSQSQALWDWFVSTQMDQVPRLWFNDNLTDVTTNRTYCGFYGVTCDGEGYVIALDLNRSGLVGTIPDLRLLTGLIRLQAGQNFLNGTIPDSLWEIPTLQFVYLSDNYLSGTVPSLLESSRLRRLMIANNYLTGTIPETICSSPQLNSLDISHNVDLRGTLPTCLGNLTSLTRLRIDNLSLTGTIPRGLCTKHEMNGLSPNRFGCDAIGCSSGYYQRFGGRQINSDSPCVECLVPSNVIGSTRCLWLNFSEGHESTASPAPPSSRHSSSPSISPPPLTPSVPGIVVEPEADESHESGLRRSVIVVSVCLGVALVAASWLLFSQFLRHKRTRGEESQGFDDSASDLAVGDSGWETNSSQRILSFVRQLINCKPKGVIPLKDSEPGIAAPRFPPCYGPNGGILKSSSLKQGTVRGTVPRTRKVRFTLPSEAIADQVEQLDFCSAGMIDAPDKDLDATSETSKSLSDPEVWASWILNPGIADAGPICSSLDRTTDNDGTIASLDVASQPLLKVGHTHNVFARCAGSHTRQNEAVDILWPSRQRLDRPNDLEETDTSSLANGLVGAWGCGWLQDFDPADSLRSPCRQRHASRYFGSTSSSAGDVEDGHVEV